MSYNILGIQNSIWRNNFT